MVDPIFMKSHIQSLKPYIQKTVDNLLEKMMSESGGGPVDLIEKFALPVPSYVSSNLL